MLAARSRTPLSAPDAPLRDAVLELASKGRLSARTLDGLVERARLEGARAPEPRRPYARTVLFAERGLGEIMLASWRPGTISAPHDHGGAHGCVRVVDGQFREDVYEGTRIVARNGYRAGQTITVSDAVVHAMASLAEGGTTLHVYAGDIGPFRLFDVARRCTVRARGGAWLPADEVVGEERWTEVEVAT